MADPYNEALFLEYVEGDLSDEQRAAFENQMLQDPRLRNLVAQMVLDRHRLRTLPDEVPPDHLMDTVHGRLERSMLLGNTPQEFTSSTRKTSRGFRWRRVATIGALAAMFAIVAGVFVVTLVQLSSETPIRSAGPAGMLQSILRPGGQTADLPPSNHATHNHSASASAAPAPSDTQATKADHPSDLATATPAPASVAQTATQDTAPDTAPDTEPDQFATALAMAQQRVAALHKQHRSSFDVPDAIMQAVLPAPTEQFVVTTGDLDTAHRRLLAWMTAYQIHLLDSRVVTPSNAKPTGRKAGPLSWLELADTDDPAMVAPPSTAGVNQALSLDPLPATVSTAATTPTTTTEPVQSSSSNADASEASAIHPATTQPATAPATRGHLVMMLLQPRETTTPLAAFLKTLPDAAVTHTSTKVGTADKVDKAESSDHQFDGALPFDSGIGSRIDEADSIPAIRSTLPAAFAQALINQPDNFNMPQTPLQMFLGQSHNLPDWLLADPMAHDGYRYKIILLPSPSKTKAGRTADSQTAEPAAMVVVRVELIQRP